MLKFFPGANRAIQQLLWCMLTAVALASCGGEGGTPSNASAAAASVPVINGTPPTTAVAGEKYQYLPSVSNPNGATLSYAAQQQAGLGRL